VATLNQKGVGHLNQAAVLPPDVIQIIPKYKVLQNNDVTSLQKEMQFRNRDGHNMLA